MILRREFLRRMAFVALAAGWLEKFALALPEPVTLPTSTLLVPVADGDWQAHWVGEGVTKPLRSPSFRKVEVMVLGDRETGALEYSVDGQAWYDSPRAAIGAMA